MTSSLKTFSLYFLKWRFWNLENILPDWAKEDVEKNLAEAVDSYVKQEEERKTRFFVENVLAKFSSSLSQTRQNKTQNFVSLLYKTYRCHVAVHLFSNRSQMTSKCAKNISDKLVCLREVAKKWLYFVLPWRSPLIFSCRCSKSNFMLAKGSLSNIWAVLTKIQQNGRDRAPLLRTVPTNTEVFLCGLWLCGKSRS